MAYKKHPRISEPNDEDILWRYLDFAQFVDLLENKAIFFSNMECLPDPFEGVCPKRNVEEFRSRLLSSVPKGIEEVAIEALIMPSYKKAEIPFMNLLVNCWHCNKEESYAMWMIYAGKGIAIKTRFSRLRDSFAGTEEDILIGRIQYIHHETHMHYTEQSELFFNKSYITDKIFSKPYWYSYEKEVRVFTLEKQCEEEINKGFATQGKHVPVDINILIEEIKTSPFAPWLESFTREFLKNNNEKYKLNAKVISSYIFKEPDY